MSVLRFVGWWTSRSGAAAAAITLCWLASVKRQCPLAGLHAPDWLTLLFWSATPAGALGTELTKLILQILFKIAWAVGRGIVRIWFGPN